MTFRAAISGLQAATSELSVIGNNVANANTTGFKRSRAEFQDVYAASSAGVAGNAAGSGVNLARIAQQFDQGNVSFTDSGLDLAISGQGFFIVEDGGGRVYTRAGAFGMDREGFIVNSGNQKLIGFTADAAGNITGAQAPLQISASGIAPSASTQIGLTLNLDASATAPAAAFDPTDSSSFNNATSTTVYDSLGNSHLATMYYRKTAANTWESYAYVDGNAVDGPTTLGFSSAGALTNPASGTVTTAAFNPGGGAANMTLAIDYDGSTQYGSPFAVGQITQDGYTTGQLSGLDIDKEGIVFARYTNGQSAVLGQVAMANFANAQGLQPLGDSNWGESFAAGAALVGAPGTSNLGMIQSGALEDSNVDLAEELVQMIVAQRNYQANAQVISTADDVTQAVINIR